MSFFHSLNSETLNPYYSPSLPTKENRTLLGSVRNSVCNTLVNFKDTTDNCCV